MTRDGSKTAIILPSKTITPARQIIHALATHPGQITIRRRRPGSLILDLLPVPSVKVDRCFVDGETLHELDGLQVIHTPGHSAGQIAFFWPQEGAFCLLEMRPQIPLGLRLSISYEDLELGKKTLARLAKL